MLVGKQKTMVQIFKRRTSTERNRFKKHTHKILSCSQNRNSRKGKQKKIKGKADEADPGRIHMKETEECQRDVETGRQRKVKTVLQQRK